MLHALSAALELDTTGVHRRERRADAAGVPLVRPSESPADVALGPCEDGGYYAIACRRTHPRMFDGVTWLSAETLAQTEEAARRCGLSVERGPGWYDVDRPEDLLRLEREQDLGAHTRLWFNGRDRMLAR